MSGILASSAIPDARKNPVGLRFVGRIKICLHRKGERVLCREGRDGAKYCGQLWYLTCEPYTRTIQRYQDQQPCQKHRDCPLVEHLFLARYFPRQIILARPVA